jgi:hypothetical protein
MNELFPHPGGDSNKKLRRYGTPNSCKPKSHQGKRSQDKVVFFSHHVPLSRLEKRLALVVHIFRQSSIQNDRLPRSLRFGQPLFPARSVSVLNENDGALLVVTERMDTSALDEIPKKAWRQTDGAHPNHLFRLTFASSARRFGHCLVNHNKSQPANSQKMQARARNKICASETNKQHQTDDSRIDPLVDFDDATESLFRELAFVI